MSVAVFVSFERELPGVQGWEMCGKTLAKYLDRLDRVAARLKLTPLGDFQGMSADEFAELLGGDDDEPEAGADVPPEFRAMIEDLTRQANELTAAARAAGPPADEWFEPADGLTTVDGLIEYVRGKRDKFRRAEPLLQDLQDVRKYIRTAQENGVRFRLSMDI